MTVTRCNADLDGNGLFQPVLQVAVNGETHVYRMGSDGLTRSIVFNSKAAIDWAVGMHAADATDVIYGVCSVEGSSAPAAPVEVCVCGCYSEDSLMGMNQTQIGPIDKFATV